MKPLDDRILTAALDRYHFDRESGCFFHIIRNANNEAVITGKFAGTTTPAGIRLTVGNRHVMAHHLAWRIFEGEWPIASVKHWDGDVMNCKAANLYSPQGPKKRKAASNKESQSRVDFLKSIGITTESMQRAMLDRIRKEQGEKAHIEAMHMMRRINDEQKAALLIELRKLENS